MSDRGQFSSSADQKTDQMLRQAFIAPGELSGDFENQVMSSIKTSIRQNCRHKTVLVIMMAYWAAASLTGSWLLFERTPFISNHSSLSLAIVLTLMAVTAAGAFFLLRQSRMKLSDLFLGTIRRTGI